MAQVVDIDREGSYIIVTYKSSKTERFLYSPTTYSTLCKDAILYHKELFQYHQQLHNKLIKKMGGGLK